MSQVVNFRVEDAIAYVSFNRPQNFNALNAELSEQMARTLEKCFDPAIRCVVITGEGKAFCAGGDIGFMKESPTLSDGIAELAFWLNRLVTNIRTLPKPVIAAINGSAAGAGYSIAMSCDLRFGSTKTKLKQAYTSSGFVPDVGWTMFVPSIIGWGKTMDLMLRDRLMLADEAKELGLLNDIFEEDVFMDKVIEEAKRLAAGPTFAFGEAKILLNASQMAHMESQVEKERAAMMRAGATEDVANAVEAFLNKTTPTFVGK